MGEAAKAVPMRVGEATIDGEHDLQMQMLDSLTECIRKGNELVPAKYVLDQFIEFSDMHFLSEQLVMRLHGYPGYEPHLEEHTQLMKKVREIRANIAAGEQELSLRLTQELKDWLLTHIATEDVSFGEFLKSREAQAE